jgi:hypothetical protein
MMRGGWILMALALVPVACGGENGGTPTGPSATRASAVTVTVPSTLIVGQPQQATASAAVAGGAAQSVASGFRSDVPAVASVTDAGMVTPVSNGLANIYVVYGGQQGTKQVRVVPGLQGSWRGSYVIRSCSQTGSFAQPPSFCDTFRVNAVLPVFITVSQTADRLTGQFFLGTVEFPAFEAPIGPDGFAAPSSTRDANGVQTTVSWQITSPQASRLTGRHSQTWRIAGASGEGRIEAEIVDWLNLIAGAAMPNRQPMDGRSVSSLLKAMQRPE